MTDREPEPLAEYPDVLTGAEVAKILRLDSRSIARLAERGELPAFRAGSGPKGAWRFDKRRIVALIENRSPWGELPPLLAESPPVLTPLEVGAILRYDPTTVSQMAAGGTLPGFKTTPGSPRAQWRFDRRRISALIETPPPPAVPGEAVPPTSP